MQDLPFSMENVPNCVVCGSSGKPLYHDLRDYVHGVTGNFHVSQCSNVQCGTMWLNPRPDEATVLHAYVQYQTHEIEVKKGGLLRELYTRAQWGYLARRYGYVNRSDLLGRLLGLLLHLSPGRVADADFSIFYQPYRDGANLLDVGCGNGRMIAKMQAAGWQVMGIDFDPIAIESARTQGLDAHVGRIEEIDFPSDSFDVVASSHVLEHVHDPEQFLKESLRLVKPGGRLLVITPNARSTGSTYFGRHWRGLEPPRHLHLFTPHSLANLASMVSRAKVQVWTTIRNARGIYLASNAIREAEKKNKLRAAVHNPMLRSELWQYALWMRKIVHPMDGEEIVLEIIK